MDLSDDFDLSGEDIPASARLQAEWMGISAIREMISFARRSDSHVSYLDALAIGKELSPDLYDNPKTLIGRSHETPIVSEYKQRAEAKSRIAGQSTTPLDLINADL